MSLSKNLCLTCANKHDQSQEHCSKFKRIPDGLCRIYERDTEIVNTPALDPDKVLALAGSFGWGRAVGVIKFNNRQLVAFAEAAIKNQESLRTNESNGSRVIPVASAR